MASVQVKGLRKAYRGIEAVKEISFSVEDGEFFCLLGPPGAGKTTVLRIISGLENPDQGDVYLGGERVNDVHPMERDVAMVFEDLALYPHMTAYDNLAHPLRLRKVPRSELDLKVREVAESLHISHLLDRRPDTFSGGEMRRVAVGRALVRRPKVMLLDQPLTDLDALLRQEMTGELKRLQRETGQTMIYATHDFEEAVTMADRIMVVNEGLAEQLGSPEKVYDQPQTRFVASFVGSPSMNLLPCLAESRDGKLFLSHPAFRLTMAQGIRVETEPREVFLGIRPEHVIVESSDFGETSPSPRPEARPEGSVEALSRAERAENVVKATVDIVQPLGVEQIVDLSLEDGTLVKMVTPLEMELVPEEKIGIRFLEEKISLFDAGSGQRIEF